MSESVIVIGALAPIAVGFVGYLVADNIARRREFRRRDERYSRDRCRDGAIAGVSLLQLSAAARDLDETRRVAYMSMFAGRRAEMGGTLINALCHHGLGVDQDEAIRHITPLIEETATDEDRQWMLARIGELTDLARAPKGPLPL